MYYYYPSYGKYTAKYQNLLDTCGEEIITRTIKYYTFCSQTGEKDTLSGFPMEVQLVDDRIAPNKLKCIMPIYINAGRGEFELKMPKSIYDKVMSGDEVLKVRGSCIEDVRGWVEINNKTYNVNGNPISASDLRAENPSRMGLMLSYVSR